MGINHLLVASAVAPNTQVPQLVVCRSLADEVASLAELLSPIANPQLAAMLKRALLDMFNSVTQVRWAA